MIWLLVVLLAYIAPIAMILILEFRNPSKAVAWMFILFLCPFIGFITYYFVAKDYTKRKWLRLRSRRPFPEAQAKLRKRMSIVSTAEEAQNPAFQNQKRLFGLLTHWPKSPITGRNQTQVYSEGETAFSAMLEEMEKAKDHIHVQFYIFRADGIGSRFQEVMIRKAKEGVKVRLLCDGLGSYLLRASFVRRLRAEGVEVYFFLPPLTALQSRRLNYRNHRKIIVVDGTVGFVGGLNVGDDYLGLYAKTGYWRDTHLQLRGDAVYFLQMTFVHDWRLASGQRIEGPGLFPDHRCEGREQVQILTSGPGQPRNNIREMCFGAMSVATRRIWIASPYFIPDEAVYTALKTAALSGVEVIVILPYHADHRLVKLASLSYVEELLAAGVKFYQYTKGFIHAKVLLVDDLLASVGTANMDMRSFFYNFEMTALLFDQGPIAKLADDFERDISDSVPIRLAEFARRSRWQKGMELLARLLSPLL
ncbi:cardiolipin synthase [Paenibacillus macerans]|uniref:Cardiolipin synthase n=1 Tax=Paenibacillus macerans TaxID=44252 RepID=A0A090Z9B0_PAEMA|nr:cardiolipin synthase [Paenibacillus macerans]KFN00916.1 cardiolipin synthase [Paenibacillus macerans]MBS5911924.1 cardiolipin synthase [Paenibacillus macerans]MCY7558085.1 cardiolipin synthase [Paenibacillus macerans]MEC0135555.1 cardiolipin synthase [Paenibacillus macerans]MEC0153680.1 cardiolipin synthase [Paenibacillus macerans]